MLKLSIIIPCFCRPQLLRLGLYSLSKQTLNFPYEIIVLNDGEENDGTLQVVEEFSNKLNIKYIVTRPKLPESTLYFRIAGFALNFGIKEAKGKNLLIMSPEVIALDDKIKDMVDILEKNPNVMVIPVGKSDNGKIVKKLENKEIITDKDYEQQRDVLNTTLPFFMAVNRQKYIDIGGYDENFIGYCFDDTDFVTRMLHEGCQYQSVSMRVIHLKHSRERKGLSDKTELYQYNRDLFKQKHSKDSVITEKNNEKKWELNKIPKIAHFYWGEEILPYARYLTIHTFAKQNPDWKINYYYPKSRYPKQSWESFELKYDITKLTDYTTNLKSLNVELIEVDFSLYLLPNDISEVFKSDLLRWKLLSTVGGLWSDMDIIYFRPMNELLDNTQQNKYIDTAITINEEYGHSIGFLMSSPNNTYFKHILLKTAEYYNPKQYQSLGTGILIPEVKDMKTIKSKFPELNVLNIDTNAVYAYNAMNIKLIYNSKSLEKFTKNSVGIHWYAGHPLAGDFVTKLTSENYDNFNNVIGCVINLSLNQSLKTINFLLRRNK